MELSLLRFSRSCDAAAEFTLLCSIKRLNRGAQLVPAAEPRCSAQIASVAESRRRDHFASLDSTAGFYRALLSFAFSLERGKSFIPALVVMTAEIEGFGAFDFICPLELRIPVLRFRLIELLHSVLFGWAMRCTRLVQTVSILLDPRSSWCRQRG
jgi:hypothetical protein